MCQIFFFNFLLTDDIIKLNKKEERKQYSPKMKRGLQQNPARQFRTPGSKWGMQQQKGVYATRNMDCTVFSFELKCNLMKMYELTMVSSCVFQIVSYTVSIIIQFFVICLCLILVQYENNIDMFGQ